MASVIVAWNGRCPDAPSRYRLLGHLHRLAALSDNYLRSTLPDRPQTPNEMNGQGDPRLRANIEAVDQTISGPILISSDIAGDHDTFAADARAAGLPVIDPTEPDGAPMTLIGAARLRGLSFKLFDPRALHPGADRLSFVFLESDDAPFLDGCLVQALAAEDCKEHPAGITRRASCQLSRPSIHLHAYLEDWIDCLLSWVKFFSVEDLWWRRRDEMQGYDDYQIIFESLAAERGTEAAMTAAYDAVLATFQGHAEHWTQEAALLADEETKV
jgi:hypothetical protein